MINLESELSKIVTIEDPEKSKYEMKKSGGDRGLILPYNGLDQKNTVLLPDALGDLGNIFQEILSGNEKALKSPEFQSLNFDNIKAALDWLAKTDSLSDSFKVDLLNEGWRLNYKCKPPTPEEFLSIKYIGPTAETLFEPIKKAFIEFMDPLKPYRNGIWYSCIGTGKAQPYSSKVATSVEDVIDFTFDDNTILTFNENDIVYDGKTFIPAKDVKVDIPEPTNYFIMRIYDCRKLTELKPAFEIDNYDDLIAFFKCNITEKFLKENDIYYHRHHIIPKSEGGTDTLDNLIALPYYFHIKAHYLLGIKHEQNNEKFYAFKNFKAVRRCLGTDDIPKGYAEFIKELDFVANALEKNDNYEKLQIWISKPNEKSIRIFEEDLHKYEQLGWIKGRKFNNPSNKKWVNKDGKNAYVDKEELTEYLNQGYSLGMHKTEAMEKANHVSYSTKNTKWMNKDGIRKAVKLEEVPDYLNNGWLLGSAMTPAKGTKGKAHNKQGYHWYTDGTNNIQSLSCPDGYKRGRTCK